MNWIDEIFKEPKKPLERGAKIIPITTNKKFKMYRPSAHIPTTLEVNEQYEGETIEEKVRRIMTNGEAITDSAPIIWVDRKDGILPEHNIRTDRFELAVEAMDSISKSRLAKRQQGIEERETKLKGIKGGKEDGGAEPIQSGGNQ